MAKRTKKSILWVFGQVFHYQMRLPPALEHKVASRIKPIFNNYFSFKHGHPVSTSHAAHNSVDPATGLRCRTAAIHVRGGTPDLGRRAFDGAEHLQVLRDHNVQLKKEHNATICHVYVGGDHIEDTIFYPKAYGKSPVGNLSHAFETRIDSFVFKSLPRYVQGPGEIEHQIKAIKQLGKVSMEYIYQEFMEDLRLYVHADIFVGSHSNLFVLVGSLRQAYYPKLNANATCYLDSHINPPTLNCMKSRKTLELFQGSCGGFTGGSLFFL